MIQIKFLNTLAGMPVIIGEVNFSNEWVENTIKDLI